MSRKAWVKRLLAATRANIVTGAVRHAEAASKAAIENAVTIAQAFDLLEEGHPSGLLRATGRPAPLAFPAAR